MAPTTVTDWASLAGRHSPDALVVADATGSIVWASDAVTSLLGWTHEELLGQPVEVLVPPEDRDVHVRRRQRFGSAPATRPLGGGRYLWAVHHDGWPVPVEIGLSPVRVGDATYVIAAVRDCSDRRSLEQALRTAQERLGLEAERGRIARDLHDTVAQDLYGLGLALQRMRSRGASDEDWGRVIDQVDESIRQLSATIYGLQGPEIHDGGLGELLGQVTQRSARAIGFSPDVLVRGDLAADWLRPLALTLQSVLRELLSNVARHAAASRVTVEIDATDGVALIVSDDGVGVDAATGDASGSGLANVRDRAAEVGGCFTIGRREGGGTSARWWAPRPATGK